jgi:hypothetical protein
MPLAASRYYDTAHGFIIFYKVVGETKSGLDLKKRLTLCRMQATAHWVEKDLSFCYSL